MKHRDYRTNTNDSKLLYELIELFQYGALMQMHVQELGGDTKNYYFALCGDLYVGQSPREAIETAIRNTKNET